MKVDKRGIRRRIETIRKAQSPLSIAADGAAILSTIRWLPCYRMAEAVVAYVSHGNEVPTEHLIREVQGSGRPLYLPVLRDQPGFARWQPGERLTRGAGGIPEPAGLPASLPELPNITFLPLVAWTDAGDRLGRGGGFYDRAFGRRPAQTTLVGLAFEFQVVTEFPRDPWDVRLDYVITERRAVWCGGEPIERREHPQEGVRN